MRERKNKQESPRDGERIEEQWGKGESISSNNSRQPAISGRSWILQESCMGSVMTETRGSMIEQNDSFSGHSAQKSSEMSSEPICSENLLFLFLPKYSHTLHPHQCQSQRAGRKAEGEAASCHSGQAPWSQDHSTDSIPSRCSHRWHPPHVFLLSAWAWQP